MTTTLRIEAHTDRAKARAALGEPPSFGKTFADLMVRVHHTAERGWHDAAIVPFAPVELSPAAKVLHYSQEIFEGHKAYGQPDGSVALFRPELNARRLNDSARRLRLPEIPEALQLEATETLVDLTREWVPRKPGTSLYIRPTLIGTEPSLGVAPSGRHLYFIIVSPVGAYFPRGFACVSILVEEEHVRAAPGGVGAAKTGGNYAAGLDAQERAREAGYDQVLWLDARERRYVEELNAMNVFLVDEGVLLTPPLEGTVLPGITRQSVLELAGHLGIEAEERRLSIDDVARGLADGRITEMFAAGTAAVITPIGTLGYRGERVTVGDGAPGLIARNMYEAITGIQYGLAPDRLGWMRIVGERAGKPTVSVAGEVAPGPAA